MTLDGKRARDPRSSGEFSKLPDEGVSARARPLTLYLIEPIWQHFSALLPDRKVDHPLGCHRPRILDRVIFEKLVEVLVFGCAYEKIADATCPATTLRDRRDLPGHHFSAGTAPENSAPSSVLLAVRYV